MRILVTGNLGYIGSVLTPILIKEGHEVVGYDIGYYEHCLLAKWSPPDKQIRKDIRDIKADDLEGIEAIIHLAGLSNDPLGAFDEKLTYEINYNATIELCKLARSSGVSRFVYASSQSMYGISKTDDEIEEDNSEKNAITAYARTKWEAEKEINNMGDEKFCVVSFRPSTVYGASPRLRSDIVFNNFVGCAYTTRKIEIKSDGSPIRPVVHVKDVCSAFIAGLKAPKNLLNKRAYNVGILKGNYTVRQLAEAAQMVVKDAKITYTGEYGNDERTYRVSFSRINNELKEWFKPQWNLVSGGNELLEFFDGVAFDEEDFRGAKTNRLKKLQQLVGSKKIGGDLRYV